MHTSIHFYLQTCRPAYIHTIYSYLHICMLSYMHTCLPAYLHIKILEYLHTGILVYMQFFILEYLHTCIYAYMHICILTYFHTCKLAYNTITGSLSLFKNGIQIQKSNVRIWKSSSKSILENWFQPIFGNVLPFSFWKISSNQYLEMEVHFQCGIYQYFTVFLILDFFYLNIFTFLVLGMAPSITLLGRITAWALPGALSPAAALCVGNSTVPLPGPCFSHY